MARQGGFLAAGTVFHSDRGSVSGHLRRIHRRLRHPRHHPQHGRNRRLPVSRVLCGAEAAARGGGWKGSIRRCLSRRTRTWGIWTIGANSPRTIRTYGCGLQAFCRWLGAAGLTLAAVRTEDLLGFVSACPQETVRGRGGPSVVDMQGRRTDRLAPGTVNLRLATVSGLFEFLVMRDPSMASPVPKGRPSSWFAAGSERAFWLIRNDVPRPAPGCDCARPDGCRGP
ncbi:MAG TPA: site-specific integrase [Actinomycetota bacterium]|nr:site-specific integrase [Actinomycetota bacterium]